MSQYCSSRSLPVLSPCIGQCQLDAAARCTGCFRDLSQITTWTQLTAREQRQVIALCDQRRSQTTKC
ncbi:DUF1289 domain-containing protein [Salinimonas sediminis]|uniref:DUF1289 domain-containing protein n=1 Tax=Salinimonas sediminis TaxID=2303538 RepID=A0A346NKF6_9ALTE|nr:DUF1289 domain-containing protein [Salinimonas sediminis]AXR06013.1 DUF1289 domain-containing protein [Salinimonas sediminis]